MTEGNDQLYAELGLVQVDVKQVSLLDGLDELDFILVVVITILE